MTSTNHRQHFSTIRRRTQLKIPIGYVTFSRDLHWIFVVMVTLMTWIMIEPIIRRRRKKTSRRPIIRFHLFHLFSNHGTAFPLHAYYTSACSRSAQEFKQELDATRLYSLVNQLAVRDVDKVKGVSLVGLTFDY